MSHDNQQVDVPVNFADRLADAVRRCRTPLIVGLDPRWKQMPESLVAGISPGDAAAAAADCFRRFCCEVIDVVAPLVPAVKPQAAFFERLGSHGMQALAEVIRYARQKGLLVIFDGKRNDIGSTATAYAEGILGPESDGGWGADSLTVNPYMGDDSLEPFTKTCGQRGAGIFVLVKTSNPGGVTFQDLVADGKPLYRHVAELVARMAAEQRGDGGYSAVGAVVGATFPDQLAELRSVMPHSWLLVPGFGSQGGGPQDVVAGFDEHGLGAIINSSRAIIFAYEREQYVDKYPAANWQRAVEAATQDTIAALRAEGVGSSGG